MEEGRRKRWRRGRGRRLGEETEERNDLWEERREHGGRERGRGRGRGEKEEEEEDGERGRRNGDGWD